MSDWKKFGIMSTIKYVFVIHDNAITIEEWNKRFFQE